METQTKALTNRPLPDGTEERLRSRLEDGERLLFTVVCDLSPTGGYSDSVLAVTDRHVLYTEEDGSFTALPYTDIAEAAVKRMYGGGIHQQRRGRRNAGQRAARSGGGLRPDEAGLSQVRTAVDP